MPERLVVIMCEKKELNSSKEMGISKRYTTGKFQMTVME